MKQIYKKLLAAALGVSMLLSMVGCGQSDTSEQTQAANGNEAKVLTIVTAKELDNLTTLTIENNIKFGNPAASHEEVVKAAQKACCHEFIMSLPDGYGTVIGEGGATLSGGEKQRISIARAILKDAPIIILDEATSSVDPENENLLMGAIAELTKNKTVIMIAHRLKTVRNADQIFVLSGGHIVQTGKHEDLIRQPGIYADFIGIRKKAIGWKLK